MKKIGNDMIHKITLGTANFTQPYGVLSAGLPVSEGDVYSICVEAERKGIKFLDTAMGYGDIASVTPKDTLKQFQIITKFSVLGDYNILESALRKYKTYGILIHDPYHIKSTNRNNLKDWLENLKEKDLVQKIGVSVYDTNDLDAFISIIMPDIIQIPLNPFNQTFNNENFKRFVKKNKIEIYARSLFLQGVLLADTLPNVLEPLRPFWLDFQEKTKNFPSKLHALLNWAFSFEWITSWVLGVSSLKDFNEIIEAIPSHMDTSLSFAPVNHPLVDPREWAHA